MQAIDIDQGDTCLLSTRMAHRGERACTRHRRWKDPSGTQKQKVPFRFKLIMANKQGERISKIENERLLPTGDRILATGTCYSSSYPFQ